MFNRQMLLQRAISLGLILTSTIHPTNPLSPGSPVVIISSNNVFMPVVVTGTSAGFMTMAVLENALQSNFSINDGATWNSPASVPENAYLPMWVSGNTNGFMATWIGTDIGYTTAAPIWSFSSNNGTSWSTAASIVSGPLSTTVYSPAVVAGTSAGFMAAWRDGNDNNAYAAFTSNNGTTWSVPVNVSNTGNVASAVLVAGTSAGFMIVWVNDSGFAFASFTSNHGGTWSSPVQITDNVASDMWITGNSSGFLATWSDNSGNVFSSFSSNNGSTWSSPTTIATNVLESPTQTDVSAAGGTSGFVAAWIGSDHNAYGSYSSDHGGTWSMPVLITHDGSVALGNIADQHNGYSFVSVCAVGDNYMFAWLGNNNDTYSSFAAINAGPNPDPTPTINPPTELTGVQQKNDFGLLYELFNTLQWQLSSSSGVTGYRIYRNGELIATVDATTTSYEDHNQTTEATHYSVIAFDGSGNTSSAATVTIG